MFRKLFAAAALALVVTVSSATTAHAAPIFLKPDINYASLGDDALQFTDKLNYSLSISTSVGDSMIINDGTAFSTISDGSILVNVSGGTGSLLLSTGTGDATKLVSGTLLSTSSSKGLFGGDTHNVFAVFRITESNMDGFKVGQLAGITIFSERCTDVNGVDHCNAKGDLAPVVPEPATLGLVIMSLGGLAVRARRKLVV